MTSQIAPQVAPQVVLQVAPQVAIQVAPQVALHVAFTPQQTPTKRSSISRRLSKKRRKKRKKEKKRISVKCRGLVRPGLMPKTRDIRKFSPYFRFYRNSAFEIRTNLGRKPRLSLMLLRDITLALILSRHISENSRLSGCEERGRLFTDMKYCFKLPIQIHFVPESKQNQLIFGRSCGGIVELF